MNSDKVKRNVSAVDRKSKTNFKKGRKAMKTRVPILVMLFLFFPTISANAGPKSDGAGEGAEFAPGVVMVKFVLILHVLRVAAVCGRAGSVKLTGNARV